MKFTPSQSKVFAAIESGKNIFITGPGGTGKSTIITEVKKRAEIQKKVIGITATTGAAAVLIAGRTLHSFLGIGLAKESSRDLVRKIRGSSKIVNVWTTLQLLVIDEISMCPADLFDKLSFIGKSLRGNSLPFGGIQLVISGDFLQLPCIFGKFVFEAEEWKSCQFEICHLREIIRQSDSQFQDCLNRARFGELTDLDIKLLSGKRNFEEKTIKPTKILCHNVDVDEINSNNLKKLPSDKIFSYDIEIKINPDFFEKNSGKIDPSKFCSAQEKVELGIGAQVMLLVNLDPALELVNGSRGVVLEITSEGLPLVQFKNHKRVIGFHAWEVKEEKSILATIYQIPLKLAYAITVHKSQGCTLDCAIIDLRGVFEYGQAYVALSRVKDLKSLIITNISKSLFRAHPKALKFYKNLEKDELKEE